MKTAVSESLSSMPFRRAIYTIDFTITEGHVFSLQDEWPIIIHNDAGIFDWCVIKRLTTRAVYSALNKQVLINSARSNLHTRMELIIR